MEWENFAGTKGSGVKEVPETKARKIKRQNNTVQLCQQYSCRIDRERERELYKR